MYSNIATPTPPQKRAAPGKIFSNVPVKVLANIVTICFFIVIQINLSVKTVTEGIMLIGRLVGWLFLGISLLMASGDAVLALGPGDHTGIVTRDVWVLLAGRDWDPSGPSIAALLMAWPAWTVIAPLGLMLLWSCRPRRQRIRGRSRHFS
jgi:hypothetical protein